MCSSDLFIFGSLVLSILLAIGGYFQAVEKMGSAFGTEKLLVNQLRIFHDRLKASDGADEARSAMKMAEGMTGQGSESELIRELKKSYAPAIAVFASKPREAEPRFSLIKKRELLDNLANAYRKEIPNGEISIRAAYLNLLFDTQSSLLNETDEMEQVYLRKSRERMDSLKALVPRSDAGLAARVAAIDNILQSYERGFQQAVKWRAEKRETLSKIEKNLPVIAKTAFSDQDSLAENTRRTFLYVCFISVVIVSVGFLCLYIGLKILRLRAEMKRDGFLTYLRSFGSENPGHQVASIVESLRSHPDWAPLIAEVQRAEEVFLRSFQSMKSGRAHV